MLKFTKAFVSCGFLIFLFAKNSLGQTRPGAPKSASSQKQKSNETTNKKNLPPPGSFQEVLEIKIPQALAETKAIVQQYAPSNQGTYPQSFKQKLATWVSPPQSKFSFFGFSSSNHTVFFEYPRWVDAVVPKELDSLASYAVSAFEFSLRLDAAILDPDTSFGSNRLRPSPPTGPNVPIFQPIAIGLWRWPEDQRIFIPNLSDDPTIDTRGVTDEPTQDELAKVRNQMFSRLFNQQQIKDFDIWGWGLGRNSALGRNLTTPMGFTKHAAPKHYADGAREDFKNCVGQSLLLSSFIDFRQLNGDPNQSFVFAQAYANWLTLTTTGNSGFNIIEPTGTKKSFLSSARHLKAIDFRETAYLWANSAIAVGKAGPPLDKFFDLDNAKIEGLYPKHDINPKQHAIAWALTDYMIRGEHPLPAQVKETPGPPTDASTKNKKPKKSPTSKVDPPPAQQTGLPLLPQFRQWVRLMHLYSKSYAMHRIPYTTFQAISWMYYFKNLVSQKDSAEQIEDFFMEALKRAFSDEELREVLVKMNLTLSNPPNSIGLLSNEDFGKTYFTLFSTWSREVEKNLFAWILQTYPPEMKVPAFSSREDGFIRFPPTTY